MIQSPIINNAPLYRTAWRRLQRRPFQYVLLVLGVAIGVAMMVSIDIANGSARRAFELSTDAITGKTTHRIVADANGIDESVYVQIRRELGYELAAPVVDGYVNVPALGDQPLRLLGVDPFAEAPFRNYFGSSPGGNPSFTPFLTEPNGLIMSTTLAEQYDVVINDVIELDVAGELVAATIVGLLEPEDTITEQALETLMFADVASAQEILGLRGTLTGIDLIVRDENILDQIEAMLPANVRLETAASQANTVQQLTAAFELNLTALSLLALIVGMFLIYNTVTFSVVQRRPLFGVLRSLGVTGQQLFRLIMMETAVLGFIGALIGVGLGVALGRVLVGLITQTINDFYFTVNVNSVSIPVATVIKGLLIGLGSAILAALMPAREAMITAPQTTLRRSSLEAKTTRLMPYLVAGWAILSLVGYLLLNIPTQNIIVAFAGLFAVLFAFALLTAPVTVLIMNALVPILGKLFGAIGRMAPRDIVRSLSRTSVAIAALMTAVSVIVGVSIMIGSFRTTVVTWLNATLQADIYVSPPTRSANSVRGEIDQDIVQAMGEWEGITAVSTARHASAYAPAFEREVGMIAVSGDISGGDRPYLWTGVPESEIFERMQRGEGVIISEPLYIREGLSLPPDPIILTTPDGDKEFPVLAVFYDYASQQGIIWMGAPDYVRYWQDEAISTVALFFEEDVNVGQVVDDMQAQFSSQQEMIIQSNKDLRDGSIEIFDRTFAITNVLQLLSVIVAFIGVLSSLMSQQLERSRELGTLRATGMTVRQLWAKTLLETGLMGAVAGILAMPTGYLLAFVLIHVINVRSFGWSMNMNLEPSYFLQAAAVSVVAALLAGIYPSLKLGGLTIASALRSD